MVAARAFIAVHGVLIEKYLEAACLRTGVKCFFFKGKANLIGALRKERPDILFLQASVLEEAGGKTIEEIKADLELGESFIVVPAGRQEGADFAYEAGADAFLPVPFVEEQIDSIFRRALNLPKKVLIVSEKLDEKSELFEILVSRGYILLKANSGEEGLEITDKNFPELVLFDSEISGMKGATFCQRIKDSPNISRIPIVVMMANNEVEAVEECFKKGARDILLVPYHSDESIRKITNIVSPLKKGRKEKVLIVDDSTTMRNLIVKMFKQLSFEVRTSENGKDALRELRREKPDIIISDYDMPVMDGWEFCSRVKSARRTKDIPIIMVTNRDSNIDLKKGELLGVSAYLPKPFILNDLKKVVRNALDESKRRKEQEIIARYVAKDTIQNVSDVLDGLKDREPEERFISILFVDIVAFTPRCEHYSPKQVVKLLNTFFDTMVIVLQSNDAIVDKFIGDAVVARFDSGDREQDARNAVKSAIEMLQALEAFNRESLEEIHVRIGVNSGTVFMGNIGSEKHRLEYAMIGDNVNVAQRLETCAPHQGCLISKYTHDLVEGYIEVGELKEISVKGRTSKVPVYQLLGIVSDSDVEADGEESIN